MLVVLAGAALLIGPFLIANTFSIVLTQRTRELAMLRAAGATGRQVFRMVFGEAVLLGITGSGLGVLAGIGAAAGLRDLVGWFGVAVPDGSITLLPRSLLLAFALGVVVTVLAAAGPSRKAARVAPLQALRESATDTRIGPVRALLGILIGQVAILAVGAVLLAHARTLWLGLAALCVVVSLVMLGPAVTPWLAQHAGRRTSRLTAVKRSAATSPASSPPGHLAGPPRPSSRSD